MTTFLKKLASIIVTVGAIAAGVSPLIAGALPGAAGAAVQQGIDKFEQIVGLVLHAEVFGQLAGLSGPDKARALAPMITQILLDYARIRGWKISDEGRGKVLAAAQTIGGGFADFLNAVDPDSVDAEVAKIKS